MTINRIPGELAPCPCADKATCPECNGTMPPAERIRRRHARMTGPEARELWLRIQQVCQDVEEDDLDPIEEAKAGGAES